MKLCPSCGETLPASSFYRCSGAKDGLRAYCKTCWKADVRARKLGKTPFHPRPHQRLASAIVKGDDAAATQILDEFAEDFADKLMEEWGPESNDEG